MRLKFSLLRPREAQWIVIASFATLCGFLAAPVAVHAASMSERDKIDALLTDVESHSELKFLRLGSLHTSSEAASMLRTKLRFAGSRVKTADDFINDVATATLSGHPYYVIYPDGKRVSSSEFLHGELERLTATPQAARVKP